MFKKVPIEGRPIHGKGRATLCCFLFGSDIRDLSMTPETCQAYNIVVWDVSARYPVKLELSTAKSRLENRICMEVI